MKTTHAFPFAHHHHPCARCSTLVCCMVGHPTSYERAGGKPRYLCRRCDSDWRTLTSRENPLAARPRETK